MHNTRKQRVMTQHRYPRCTHSLPHPASSLFFPFSCLEHLELLLAQSVHLRLSVEHVEADGLGQGAALADGDDITLLHLEARRHVGGEHLVALLETVVLADVVQVVATHGDRALHLGGHDDATQNAATDVDVAGERALLVNIGSLDGFLGGLEAQTNRLPPAHGLGAQLLVALGLLANKDGVLLLE